MNFASVILATVLTNSTPAHALAQTDPEPRMCSAYTNAAGLVCSMERGRLWLRRTMVKAVAPDKRTRDEYSKVVDSLTSSETGRVWRVAFDNTPARRPRRQSKNLPENPKQKTSETNSTQQVGK